VPILEDGEILKLTSVRWTDSVSGIFPTKSLAGEPSKRIRPTPPGGFWHNFGTILAQFFILILELVAFAKAAGRRAFDAQLVDARQEHALAIHEEPRWFVPTGFSHLSITGIVPQGRFAWNV